MGDLTVAELFVTHGVDRTLTGICERQAVSGMSPVFSGRAAAAAADQEAELGRLRAKSGDSVLRRDVSRNACER